MTVMRLALAYARRRPLSTLLVVVLLAIGVATVTLTLLLSRELADRLTRDAAGIDLVVGAKGSPLQIVLAGVYHVDVPPGNIPLAAVAELRANPLVRQVIPLALGDSFRGFRIVGTEPALVAHYGATLRDGRLWQGPLEAVVGSAVAAATGIGVGGEFTGELSFGNAKLSATGQDGFVAILDIEAHQVKAMAFMVRVLSKPWRLTESVFRVRVMATRSSAGGAGAPPWAGAPPPGRAHPAPASAPACPRRPHAPPPSGPGLPWGRRRTRFRPPCRPG